MTVEPGFGGPALHGLGRRPRWPRRRSCSRGRHRRPSTSTAASAATRRPSWAPTACRRMRRRLGAVPARAAIPPTRCSSSGACLEGHQAGTGDACLSPLRIAIRSRSADATAAPARDSRRGAASTTQMVGAIGPGLVVLVGIGPDDTPEAVRRPGRQGGRPAHLSRRRGQDQPLARATSAARSWPSASSRCSRTRATAAGRRSSAPRRRHLGEAALPSATPSASKRAASASQRGVFGAEMQVELVNDGPMTIWLDTAAGAPPR